MNFFAHEGHVHEAVTEPNILLVVGMNLLPLLIIAVIVSVLRLLKVKKQVQGLVLLALLLVCGVTMFQWAPFASVVSLVTGFGLCLAALVLPAKK